jgi:hypothetical protein
MPVRCGNARRCLLASDLGGRGAALARLVGFASLRASSRSRFKKLEGEGKMTNSTYLARLMGPVMLTIGVGMVFGMLLEGDAYSSLMKEFIASRALIFITGGLALTAGLAVVNAHNLWVPDWRVIVTILGWLLILRGISNLVFPVTVQTLGDRMIASHAGVLAGAAITIVIGAILSVMGYEDLWNGAKPAASTAAKRPRKK